MCFIQILLRESEVIAIRGEIPEIIKLTPQGILGAHYRRKLDWDEEPLQAAAEAVQRLTDFRDRVRGLGEGSGGEEIEERAAAAASAFEAAMDDDLNLPEAVGHVFGALRDLNRMLDARTPSAGVRERLSALIGEVDDVLGVLPLRDREREAALSAEEEGMLARRAAARQRRDFTEADSARAQLAERGIIVEDTPQGQRWKRA